MIRPPPRSPLFPYTPLFQSTLTATGVLSWTYGTMAGTGQTNIAPGATLSIIEDDANYYSYKSLDTQIGKKHGTTPVTGTNYISYSALHFYNGAGFNNSGLFD